MATAEQSVGTQEQQLDKGLKSGALGLISTTVIATASVAPAYSIAATLVFVVGAVALQAPAVAVLAFVPMLLTSIGYSELNKADPDCGTTFTWATRAFGPKTGWFGGWAIVAADVLVMASLAQVASQYVFLLFGANGIGSNATSSWVLLGGIIWIVLMTAICYVGIEVSANFQKILLGIELTMLFVLSIVPLVTYALVIFSMQAFAGVKTTGNGLGNLDNAGDVLSVQGKAIFGATGFGPTFYHLLLLMVLSSAAASTQTTILPTARTTLSMAVYKAIPPQFARIHRKHLTPTVSTIVMGAISIVVYVIFNYSSNGIGVIGDAVIAIGLYIAFYYGLTGFTCAWYYRKNLTSSARNLWMQGILPVLGGLILYFLGGWSVWLDYDVATENDYTMWTVPFIHWQIGGAFVIAVAAGIIGLAAYLYCKFANPAFFRKETLTRGTETLVPDV